MSETRARRRPQRRRPPLLERERELTTIDDSLAAAAQGRGTVLLVHGAPGTGRSVLLRAAADRAREAGADVLAATGTALEAAFPFGVALQLLEPAWRRADAGRRAALLDGAAGPAAELLAGARPADGAAGDEYRPVHALYAALRNLIRLSPGATVVLTVDDLQWADRPSARFLAYLGERVADLPVVIVTALVPGLRAPTGAVDALRARSVVLTLGPLSAAAVAEIVRRRLPGASDPACAAMATATAGSPALVQAVLDGDDPAAPNVGERPPGTVVDSVRRRLDRLSTTGRTVAIAAAVLGREASIAHTAALAPLPAAELLPAAEELVGAGLLESRCPPLSFAQPLVRAAVLAGLAPSERSRAHARAAAILAGDAQDAPVVAPHLMAVAPGSDPASLTLLRRYAITARADGDSALAISLIERALAHQPPPEQRSELLIELALAEAELGMPTVTRRLAAAKRLTSDPRRGAKIALLEAQVHYDERNYRQAAAVLEPMLAREDTGEDLRRRSAVAYVSAAALVPDLRSQALDVRADVLGAEALPPGAPPAEAVALAHTTLLDALGGAAPATVRAQAELAWDGGALLAATTPRDPTVPSLLIALMAVDELHAADEIWRQLGELAAGAEWLDGGLRALRAWWLYLRGQIAAAGEEAARSAQAHRRHWPAQTGTALATAACCHIHRGGLAAAEAALKTMSLHTAAHDAIAPARLAIQAELRLAQHRPADALQDALAAGAGLAEVFPGANIAVVPWRTTAAGAYLALGQADAALALIEPDLEAARRLGLARQTIRGLRLQGLAIGGGQGLERLREAVALGDATDPRLEHVHALIDLGAALRRSNRRAEAREPLARGLDLASRGGATALAARAHAELMASGARPRRLALTGIESLTVSQRRVAELAAQGLTTRQIAEALFVTPKTVEFHLRSVYQKLDVGSRSELTEVLAAA